MILLGFAFLAGIITVLAPCILPVLPLVLAGGAVRGKFRPIGIIIGLVVSFSVFTLTLSWLVTHTGLSTNTSRIIGVVILATLGIVMLVPGWLEKFETWISVRFSKSQAGTKERHGFGGGILLGFALGTVWTPCAGPILASVTAVAATSGVTTQTVFITIFYALGAAIPMALIAFFGQRLMTRLAWFKANAGTIQRAFGILLLVMAALIATNLDQKLQTAIVNATPNWLPNLQSFEEKAPGMNKNIKVEQKNGNNTVKLDDYGSAPELTGNQGWINSAPLKLSDLRGKVVLVKFWTYSCINCIRTLPYVQSWYDKYHDKGFEIIAVHTPEFAFEKELPNVLRAVKDLKINYPVVQDNDYATWNAYSNRYWPAKYFIDANGHIRYVHFGEGDYDTQEKVIQELLQEAGTTDLPVNMVPETDEPLLTITPETYFGGARMERFVSPEKVSAGTEQTFSIPNTVADDHWALQGPWTINDEYAVAGKNSSLSFTFTAKHMYVVMEPDSTAQRVDVYIDGQPVQNVQVAPANVDSPTIYQVAGLMSLGTHTLRINFPDGGVRTYAATFGASDAPGVYCDQSGKCAVQAIQ